jgi:hypothetical protein
VSLIRQRINVYQRGFITCFKMFVAIFTVLCNFEIDPKTDS